MSLVEYLREKSDKGGEVISFFVTLALPSPNESISRMIDNLDVSPEVLINDLVDFFIGRDNPFIATVMEIPQTNLVDGPSLKSQTDGLIHTLKTWASNGMFHETKSTILDISQELEDSGYSMTPVEGRQLRNILLIEFLITKREYSDHENDGGSDRAVE